MNNLTKKLFFYLFVVIMIIHFATFYTLHSGSFYRILVIGCGLASYLFLSSFLFTINFLKTKIGISITLLYIYISMINIANYNIQQGITSIMFSICSFAFFAKANINNLISITKYLFYIILILFLIQRITTIGSLGQSIYYLIALMPILYLSPKKYLYLIIIVLASAISLKRTAFIIGLSSCVVALLSEVLIYRKQLKNIIMPFILVSLVVVILFKSNLPIIERLSSIEDDGGSGRLYLYENVINNINKSTINEKLWGHGGYNAVKNNDIAYELAAHNDFLEITYDYGYFGLSLYVLFILSLIGLCVKIKKISKECFEAMLISMVIFFIISMFSMFLFAFRYSCFLFAFWGFMHKVYNTYSTNNTYKTNAHPSNSFTQPIL